MKAYGQAQHTKYDAILGNVLIKAIQRPSKKGPNMQHCIELVPKLSNKQAYQKEGTRTYPESAENTVVPTFHRQVPLPFER